VSHRLVLIYRASGSAQISNQIPVSSCHQVIALAILLKKTTSLTMSFLKTSRNMDSCERIPGSTNSSPEFIGRIPRIVPLHPLSEEDLVRIIQEPEDSLLSQVPLNRACLTAVSTTFQLESSYSSVHKWCNPAGGKAVHVWK
jgi:hypothetical protein